MRRLLLLRHAKAERSQPGGRDHDRILSKRGRNDAAAVGGYLVRHKLVPDRALVSTSARTRETWELVAKAFVKAPKAEFGGRIYEAPPEAILNSIRETGTAGKTLIVVGHNPGMEALALLLTGDDDNGLRSEMSTKYPTAALAEIALPVDHWRDVAPGTGQLARFIRPRDLDPALGPED